MNTQDLLAAAEALNIIADADAGRVRLGGREGADPGELVKAFASLGLDVVKDHEGEKSVSWSVREAGQHVASIVAARLGKDKHLTGFAYTVAA